MLSTLQNALSFSISLFLKFFVRHVAFLSEQHFNGEGLVSGHRFPRVWFDVMEDREGEHVPELSFFPWFEFLGGLVPLHPGRFFLISLHPFLWIFFSGR
jgi:hypothetical protein